MRLILALTAAIFFGFRGVLYQWSSQKPMDRNLMLFGVFFTGMIVSLVIVLVTDQKWSTASLIGIFMGVFSFLANGPMYKGFAVGRASVIAIFTSLPPLVVIGLAYLLWGETLNIGQLFAFLIIVSGIVLIRYSSDLSLKNLGGIQWGILTMIFFGFNDVSSKQAMLQGADVFATLFMMFATGSILFYAVWMRKRVRKDALLIKKEEDDPKRWKSSKTFLWGMFVGITNITGMGLLLPAFAAGVTGLVSAVVALNVLMILLYVRFFLKEKFSRLELAGISFSFVGVIILRLFG